ncbi:MAG: ribonuclease III, partial [Gemmatimonadota bacterium]|nr:ribonuclease III [Gemmatimonadota bacterium]
MFRRGWSVVGKLVSGSRSGPSPERVRQLKKLQRRIGVHFNDLSLLEQALTHRSYSHITSGSRNDSNERMEFLGDSVLGLSTSQFLYTRFPERSEGALSKMKSLLVSRKVLSSVSREVGLGEFLLLSEEEADTGGRDRTSIIADSFEGVIGAIYLDQGYRAANHFVRAFLLAQIDEICEDEAHINYKSLLQEHVQGHHLPHPVYRVRAEKGPEHKKEFAVEVVIRNEVWGKGRGQNKKDAEQAAARAALETHLQKSGSRRGGRRARGGRTRGGEGSRSGPERAQSSRGERTVSAESNQGRRAPSDSRPSDRSRGGTRRDESRRSGGDGSRSPRGRRRSQEPIRANGEREDRDLTGRGPAEGSAHGVHASRERLRKSRQEELRLEEEESRALKEKRAAARKRPSRTRMSEPTREEEPRTP